MRKHFLSAMLIVLSLSGCATPPAPKTTAQSVALAESGLTAAYQTVADLSASQSITPSQKAEILKLLDEADNDLSIAKTALAKGLPTDATQALIQVNRLLIQYQQKLQAEGATK